MAWDRQQPAGLRSGWSAGHDVTRAHPCSAVQQAAAPIFASSPAWFGSQACVFTPGKPLRPRPRALC